MRVRLLLVAALASSLGGSAFAAPAGLPPPGQPASHEAYAREIAAAQSNAFRAALATFDAHLARAPNDVVAAVERCKLIAASGHGANEDADEDDYDDDDDGGATAERNRLHTACVDSLAQRF
ncbi:MAG: hypothetical protein JWM53_2486, partial [bacterium]|nr:hypothetical protein [bacterium]